MTVSTMTLTYYFVRISVLSVFNPRAMIRHHHVASIAGLQIARPARQEGQNVHSSIQRLTPPPQASTEAGIFELPPPPFACRYVRRNAERLCLCANFALSDRPARPVNHVQRRRNISGTKPA